MFGRKQEHERGHERRDEKEWRLAMGTVGESRLHDQDWSYRVDYRRAAGGMSRATVRALPDRNVELAIGTRIALQENVRTGEVLMHTEQPRRAADAVHLARERRGQDPGAAGAAALAGLFQAGGAEVRVTGEPQVQVVGGAQAAQVMEAVQELMSGGGDPAAARERIRQLKAELQAQAGMAAPAAPAAPEGFASAVPEGFGSAEPEGFSSAGPSTFDSVVSPPPVAPTTFSSPDPSVGQPMPAFGQPGFSPVAPATTFSSPAGAGSFSPGSATGSGAFGGFGETKSDRIAQLEDQRDRGQITPEQFAAQRQQIQDEI